MPQTRIETTVKKTARIMVLSRTGLALGVTLSLLAGSLPAGLQAQSIEAGDPEAPVAGPAQGALNIPEAVTLFGKNDPNVRRATAVVNGDIVTGTDVDQRLALILAANENKPSADELNRLRLQVLRNLIDETLQIQEAKASEVEIPDEEIDQTYNRVAQ